MAFVDHHVHFLATAAARLSVDLTECRGMADLVQMLGAACRAEGGGWVRAWGYDESLLVERRHPTRVDLDRAGEETSTGHVFNSPPPYEPDALTPKVFAAAASTPWYSTCPTSRCRWATSVRSSSGTRGRGATPTPSPPSTGPSSR